MARRAASIQSIAAGKGNLGKDLFGVQLEVRFSCLDSKIYNAYEAASHCTAAGSSFARASSKSQAPLPFSLCT